MLEVVAVHSSEEPSTVTGTISTCSRFFKQFQEQRSLDLPTQLSEPFPMHVAVVVFEHRSVDPRQAQN